MRSRTPLIDKYIELLKSSLVNDLYIENEARIVFVVEALLNERPVQFAQLFGIAGHTQLMRLLRSVKDNGEVMMLRRAGPDGRPVHVPEMRNFTELAHTMIGRKRLDNLQSCIESVLDDGVPGDFIETGIWRGGACIFVRGLFTAYGVTDRVVWGADSFAGVPPPTHAEDRDLELSARVLPVLAVSLEEVRALFARYGLLDEQVRFLKGWFKDTLPSAPIGKLAVLRLDGDLYESTMDALEPLYDKVSPGGYVIVDDYHSCPPCRRAVDAFRSARSIVEPMHRIDEQAVYWRKEK